MAMRVLCQNCGALYEVGAVCGCVAKRKKESDKDYDAHRRNQQSRQFYQSAEWKHLRAKAMWRDGGLCRACGGFADVVDHIVPIRVAWERRCALENLQALCHRCHNRKTRVQAKCSRG